MSIPPESAYVGIVRLALGSLARSAGFDEERVEDIRIAVSEACTNAVLNSDEMGSRDAIVVSWREAADQVVVEVSDLAEGAPAPGADGFDSQGFSSRLMMSLSLLRAMADDLDFDSAGRGTVTRLTFSRT